MILQYKGFNNNWCYEEANTIIWANVCVDKETKDYRSGGIRHKLHIEKRKSSVGLDIGVVDLAFVKEMHKAVDKLIQEETRCSDSIVYMIGDTRFDEMKNVCVVTLKDKDKYTTYVFTKGVYLLNNSGTTVQKIA